MTHAPCDNVRYCLLGSSSVIHPGAWLFFTSTLIYLSLLERYKYLARIVCIFLNQHLPPRLATDDRSISKNALDLFPFYVFDSILIFFLFYSTYSILFFLFRSILYSISILFLYFVYFYSEQFEHRWFVDLVRGAFTPIFQTSSENNGRVQCVKLGLNQGYIGTVMMYTWGMMYYAWLMAVLRSQEDWQASRPNTGYTGGSKLKKTSDDFVKVLCTVWSQMTCGAGCRWRMVLYSRVFGDHHNPLQ